MIWLLTYVGLALAGLVVLALFAWRLWQQVRQVGREVAAASDRIAKASAALADVQAQLTEPGGRPARF